MKYNYNNNKGVFKYCTLFIFILLFQFNTSAVFAAETKLENSEEEISTDILEKTITGIVTDESGNPLPGAAIIAKGESGGVQSDFDGNYSITVTDATATLIISYLGYLTQEVLIGDQNQVNVTLIQDANELDEVVVIGYGTSQRKDVTGAISSVNIENSPVSMQPTTNVLQTLKGTVPGVSVGMTTGAGGTPSLLIRGQNSLSSGNNPLIVLDGMIFSGSLSEIPNDDIATIDVLKDASSAAIYGSRAANGVIIITTKIGKSEKPTFTLNHYTGIQNQTRTFETMKGQEFLDFRAYNLGLSGQEDLSIEGILGEKELEAYNAGHQMDWIDEVTQFAPIQNTQLSVSGRTKKTNYYISGAYLDQKGVLDGDQFKKVTVTAKFENKITDWLKVGVNAYYNQRDYTGFTPQMYMASYYTPYSYRWLEGREGEVQQRNPTSSFLYNPYTNFYNDDLNKAWGIRATGYVEAKIPKIEGLTYRFNYTGNRSESNRGFFKHEMSNVDTWDPEQVANPSRFLNDTGGWLQTGVSEGFVMDNLLTYKKSFGDHKMDALAGYTRDYRKSQLVQFSGNDFSGAGTTVLGYYGLELADPTKKSGQSNYSDTSNIGYLGRINYSYKDRYYFTGTFRRDGASVLAPGNQFVNFPGASVAWTASEEGFVKNALPKLDYLKFRVSYGQNGNQAIGNYETLANVATGQTIFGSETFNYTYPSSLANKALTWEKTTAFNLGVDFSMFDDRVSGNVDVYKSKTTDQLLIQRLPVFTGYGSVRTNIGQVDNKGVDISLSTINIRANSPSDFEWTSGFTFSLNRTKLVSITGLDADGDGVEDDDTGSNWYIGEPLGVIYNYTVDGIVQENDTEYITTYGASPGDVKIVDIDGKDADGNLTGIPDGQINADDRSIIGNSNPNFRANFANTFTYKNFELFFDFNIIAGGGKDNYYQAGNLRAFVPLLPITGNWISGREYWTPETPSNSVPRPNYTNPYGYGFYQSRGFIRLQNLSFSYNFDDKLKDVLGVKDLKLFVTGKNLWTSTDWVGLDPETAGQFGSSNPALRTFTMGIKLSF